MERKGTDEGTGVRNSANPVATARRRSAELPAAGCEIPAECVLGLERPSGDFYRRRALELAPMVLGLIIVHVTPEGITAGRITESEAYEGPEDRACHAFGGRRTARNEAMYGPPGFAYVYFTYGNHWMFNIVASDEGVPHAVLIRSLEPVTGAALMLERRGGVKPIAIGPGRLTKAMAITGTQNRADLARSGLFVAYPPPGMPYPVVKYRVTKRIGVENTGEARDYPWRFADKP